MLPYILVTLLLFDLKSQVFGQNFDDQIVLPQGLLDGKIVIKGRKFMILQENFQVSPRLSMAGMSTTI